MTMDDATRTAAERIQRVIEHVLRSSGDWSREELAAIGAPLEEALGHLSRWGERGPDDPDHLEPLDRAREALSRAAFEAAQRPARARTAAALRAVFDLVLRERSHAIDRMVAASSSARGRPRVDARARPDEEPETFLVSDGAPRLRRPTGPRVRLPLEAPPAEEPDEPPADVAELIRAALRDADERPAEEAAAPAPPPPSPEELELRALGRELLHELAGLATLRRRNEGEAWTAVAGFEERLLDALDALHALAADEPGGAHLESAVELALAFAEENRADPGRAFARTLVLGCQDGPDAARAIGWSLGRASPYVLEALEDALRLAPSHHLSAVLHHAAAEGAPEIAELALRVLRFRREADPARLQPLFAHPSPRVVEAACRAIASAPLDPRAALELLEEVLEEEDGSPVALAAAEALTRLGSPSGAAYARRAVAGGADGAHRQGCLTLLAVAGTAADEAALLDAAEEPEGARRLGFFGSASAADTLLGLLDGASAFRASVGGAHPLAEEHEAAAALRRLTGLSPPAPSGLGQGPWSTDPGVWREAMAAAALPRGRLRLGRPFTAASVVEDALDPFASVRDREILAFELDVLTRGASLFDPGTWVEHQRRELALLGARFGSDAPVPEGGHLGDALRARSG